MDNQKAKLQEYQVTRANDIDETSALMEEKQRKRLAAEAKKRNAGHSNTSDRQQALFSYHAEKRKAEEMLLMAPMS